MGLLANLGIATTLVIASGIGGFGVGWKVESDRMAAAALKQAVKTIAVVQKQGAINTEVAAQAQAHQDQIRYVTRTITQQVPVYVSQKADADCTVPVGAVRLLDAAAAGVPATPDPAGRANDAPSGIALDSVTSSVVGNYGTALAVRAQLIDLQSWVTQQLAVKP
jgi:hypothetical protein